MKAIYFLIFLLFIGLNVRTQVDRESYYSALESEELSVLNDMLKKLSKQEPTQLNRAYRGAMVSKKASLLSSPIQKLNVFKKGVELLEGTIEEAPNNVEYRFLRLSVQEHAPAIVRYSENIEEDKDFITENFDRVDMRLKIIILDYAEDSEVLDRAVLSEH